MAKVARLLDVIVPEHYRLSLDVDMEGFTFRAEEVVDFELKESTSELVLHAVGLDVTGAELADGAVASRISLDDAAQTVTLAFEEPVKAGKHRLNLEFRGPINSSLHGFYRSQYTQDGQEKWLATTQLEAVHAREAFVCVDEPAAKAVFELTLTVPADMTALANTDVVAEDKVETAEGGVRKRVRFAPTPRMSTYLVAYMVGDFEYAESKTKTSVVTRVYATPGKKSQLGFALETAVRALEFYEDYFGIPYPLPKLDMVAVPDFSAGAMENWGLVTYRETALLLEPGRTSLSNKQRVAEVITHELAHQWFGNLVTMAWWDDLWLNEGFASWMEAFAKDKLFPDWQVWTEFVQSDVSYSMELDGLANTHPIQVPVDDPRSLDEIFDAVSYYKGSSIINMLHNYLGPDDFRKGLREYLKAHSYGNAVTGDLWQSLGAASGKPVDELMSAWTARPGFPLVSFEDGELRQERFYSSPREAAKAEASEPWPVPFAAALPGGKSSESKLVKTDAAELEAGIVASDWFKPNPGQTGFYRSLYTEPMIEALTPALEDGSLGPVDRFGLVDDVFAATAAGKTGARTALRLVEALRRETDYIVWGGLTGGLGSLTAVVEDKALRERLERFGLWLTQPNAEALGWKPRPGETAFETLMRPMVLQQAVRYDNPAVTKEALALFAEYAAGKELDPELRPVALYAAARNGDTAEFEAMLDRYRAETVSQVKISLLGSLGRFRKTPLIERYLALGLSDDVRPQDTYIVLACAARNREARGLAWTWVRDNWSLFVKRYGAGGHMLERFPLYVAEGFASHEMAAEIQDFFSSHPHPATKRPTAQAVETVELKADWYDRDRAQIGQFLDDWEASQK